MKVYHVAYVWSWPSGRRFWQATTNVDCISPDAVYYILVSAQSKRQAIQQGRRKQRYERKRREEQ
jgi:hypothetical protein